MYMWFIYVTVLPATPDVAVRGRRREIAVVRGVGVGRCGPPLRPSDQSARTSQLTACVEISPPSEVLQ